MPIKTILLPIRESDTSETLLETGMCAALRFGAHLDVLYVHPNPELLVPYATMGLSAKMRESVIEAATRSSVDQAARLRAVFETVCERRGLARRARGEVPTEPSADWLEETGVRNTLIEQHSRLADLVIVPRPLRVSPPPSSFEAALRGSGRPVLMVPRGKVIEVLSRRIGIGWNGSKEAAQAIAAARHYMREAEMVSVLTTEKRMRRRPSADDVVLYLKCHRIESHVAVLDLRSHSVGEALLAESEKLDLDLLVVGGYSRSRLRDMVMGGVTSHLIGHAELPVMLVH